MPKAPSMPAPAAPAAAPPPPPTMVDPAVIAARQNLINQQSMAGRGQTVVAQTGSNGQTLGQAVALGAA